MNKDKIVNLFTEIIAVELKIDPTDIKHDELFLSIGLDSVTCIVVLEQLERQIGKELNPILFWDYPTIDSFSEYLAKNE